MFTVSLEQKRTRLELPRRPLVWKIPDLFLRPSPKPNFSNFLCKVVNGKRKISNKQIKWLDRFIRVWNRVEDHEYEKWRERNLRREEIMQVSLAHMHTCKALAHWSLPRPIHPSILLYLLD